MKVLAIETSTMLGGVAVLDSEDGLIVEVRMSVRAAHSARLMPEVHSALQTASLSLADMDALCITVGPGSFTGLRIGLGTVKGLAFKSGLPVVAVSTLKALAWNFPFSELPVCPVLDARKGEVYAGIYRAGPEGPEVLMPEAALSPKDLAHALAEHGGRAVLAGQGAAHYGGVFLEALGQGAVFAPPHLGVPSPAAGAHLGLIKAQRGEFSDPAVLGPTYLRKSEAELGAGGPK